MRPTRPRLAASLLAGVLVGGTVAHAEDRLPGAPQVVVLGNGAARLELRHDAASGAVEVRVASGGPSGPVLGSPAVVVAGRRIPLQRAEGPEQVWRARDPALAVVPLVAALETTLGGHAYRLTLGAGPTASTATVPTVRNVAKPPAPPEKPPPVRLGPEGGRLLPLGDGNVQLELLHDVAAGRVTFLLRDRKDGSAVPTSFPPVAFVLLPTGAKRVEFVEGEKRIHGRTSRWTAVDDSFRTTPLEALLRVRIADTPYDANLGTIDLRLLDPPLEERIRIHGGRVIVFGEGSFHGEVVEDRATGTVSVWFLDPRDKTPIPLSDPPVAEVDMGNHVVVVPFDAVRDHLEEKMKATGRSDLWRARHDAFKRPGPLRGRIVARIADRPYWASLSPLVGPRGGRIVSLTPDVRAELVRDRTLGAVTVYVLDALRPADVLALPPTFQIPAREAGGEATTVTLVPVEGRPGVYRATNEVLRGTTPAPRLRLRVGERSFEEQLDPETGTPAPGTAADQDAVPGDADPNSRRSDPKEPPPATPADEDAIPGDTDPGAMGSEQR